MFFGTSILKAFWEGLGMVLGGQNPRFSHFFREKTQAKNNKIFGRQKKRILRPQEQIAGEARRSVRVRGKESAASRRESRACRTLIISSSLCLPLRPAFRIRLQIPSSKAFPHPFVPSPGPARTAALRPQFALEASKCDF